jgi:hypothetical protein
LKKKIHKLPLKVEFNYSLIGISSHENDYRLSWAINQNLNLKLSQDSNLLVSIKNTEIIQRFSVFSSIENGIKYELISCLSEQGYLFKKLKNIDYIMKISGDSKQLFLNRITHKLNKIDIVITSFLINDLPKSEIKKIQH